MIFMLQSQKKVIGYYSAKFKFSNFYFDFFIIEKNSKNERNVLSQFFGTAKICCMLRFAKLFCYKINVL